MEEGKEETCSLEHEDNFVVSDYVILEHYGEGRENLDGSSPDMGYAEEPTNINKVPDAIWTKTAGLPLKILLLVPKPTGKLLPRFRHNLHL